MIIAFQPSTRRLTCAECPDGTKLFIWCVRRWVDARFRGQDPLPVLKSALKMHGLSDTGGTIDRLMALLASHALRKIDIHRGGAIALANDEIILARALHSAENSPAVSRSLLHLLMDRTGLDAATRSLHSISVALISSALDLSDCSVVATAGTVRIQEMPSEPAPQTRTQIFSPPRTANR